MQQQEGAKRGWRLVAGVENFLAKHTRYAELKAGAEEWRGSRSRSWSQSQCQTCDRESI